MIDGITNLTHSITVTNPASNYINTSNPGSGVMRYYNGEVQVYDGYNWIRLTGGFAGVGLSYETEQLLEWVSKKRSEEMLENEMLEKYPALKSAKDQYTMIKQLCESEEKIDKNTQV